MDSFYEGDKILWVNRDLKWKYMKQKFSVAFCRGTFSLKEELLFITQTWVPTKQNEITIVRKNLFKF